MQEMKEAELRKTRKEWYALRERERNENRNGTKTEGRYQNNSHLLTTEILHSTEKEAGVKKC